MRKLLKRICLCFLLAAFFWCGTLLSDRQRLNRELVRLHVVAASDSREDQYNKLRVRDAVTESLTAQLQNIADVEQAKAYLQEKLPYIQKIAVTTLQSLGCEDAVEVSLCREAFDVRHYDDFSLPSGVYEALRIVIGEGAGENWWCVVFPSLCLHSAAQEFEDVAAGSGFPEALSSAMTGEESYELRFALLDAMGKLQNMLCAE